jgi:hypothetical protein
MTDRDESKQTIGEPVRPPLRRGDPVTTQTITRPRTQTWRTQQMTRLPRTLFCAALAVGVAVALAAAATAAVHRNAGQLALTLRFPITPSKLVTACPTGTPATTECFALTGQAAVPGLGNVSESYTAFDDQSDAPSCRHTTWTPAVITVAGKGEIDASLTASAQCDPSQSFIGSAKFTITGGSGLYAGASGSGTEAAGLAVADDWTGTLTVPGLTFDTTPPVIQGANARTILAPKNVTRIRVTYKTTAEDNVDGPLPVTCRPPSGSRLKIGRTPITCITTDSSANTATAQFTITVKRTR